MKFRAGSDNYTKGMRFTLAVTSATALRLLANAERGQHNFHRTALKSRDFRRAIEVAKTEPVYSQRAKKLTLHIFALACLLAILSLSLRAQELRVPEAPVAGEPVSIATTGSGKATFFFIGPGVAQKSDINLGEEIHLTADTLQKAGRYEAILCSDSCHTSAFYVAAAKPFSLIFLAHPSRVPVALSDSVSGVAFPFDRYRNLVTAPVNINFQLMAKQSSLWAHNVRTQNGVAWFRTNSGRSAGPLQVTAALDDLSAKRVMQQVASEPCNLRITGMRNRNGIAVQTEPVHDCAGNVIPDGTIITFTATGPKGKDTVDSPVKQGIARAQMDAAGAATVSVASGVVIGNEIRIGAQ